MLLAIEESLVVRPVGDRLSSEVPLEDDVPLMLPEVDASCADWPATELLVEVASELDVVPAVSCERLVSDVEFELKSLLLLLFEDVLSEPEPVAEPDNEPEAELLASIELLSVEAEVDG